MRWKAGMIGLALILAALAGCKEQTYLTKDDVDKYINDTQLPDKLAVNPAAAILPSGTDTPPPPTVLDPEREPRYLTLNEAIAMALEHGSIGSPQIGSDSVDNLNLPEFQGRSLIRSDGIRVLALEPAITGADIEASLAKFDARWDTSMTWQKTDEPIGGNFINSFNNGDKATFSSGLIKPLPTGGVAGITFNTQYTLLDAPPAGVTNPAYRPQLQFNFEQPLLQGFGVEINQLRESHPGSLLTPFNNSARVEGVLITRIRFDQERAEFQRNVNFLLLNVEQGYWNLYRHYWFLYSREQALRQAYAAWRINRDRYDAGRISRQDLAQTRQQYELFRQQRLEALNLVLDKERELRNVIGLPVEDGSRLIPIDAPTLSFYQPDWTTSLNEALVMRPELVLMRQDLKFRQMDLIKTKNLLLPDLRGQAQYNVNGFGTHLDGGSADQNNAFSNLASNQFQDWTIGLRMEYVLGYRDANAATRVARLRLSQSYQSLRDFEYKTQSFMQEQYRALYANYEQIRAARARREAAAVALESRLKEYLAGKIILDILLKAQQDWADALSSRDREGEFDLIVEYNKTLARFEFAKGTIMDHNNVVIAEGPLPHCAQVRAVEHERQRGHALVMRERAKPVNQPPCSYEKGNPGLPELPSVSSPSIPELYEKMPAVNEPTESNSLSGPISSGVKPVPAPRPIESQTFEYPGAARPAHITLAPESRDLRSPTRGPSLKQDSSGDLQQLPPLKVSSGSSDGVHLHETALEAQESESAFRADPPRTRAAGSNSPWMQSETGNHVQLRLEDN